MGCFAQEKKGPTLHEIKPGDLGRPGWATTNHIKGAQNLHTYVYEVQISIEEKQIVASPFFELKYMKCRKVNSNDLH